MLRSIVTFKCSSTILKILSKVPSVKNFFPAFLLTLIIPSNVVGHHSVQEYDRSTVTEIEGKILSVHWKNPHVGFSMETTNSNGSVTVWNLEAQDMNSQDRRNVPRDLLKVGDMVKVAGNASTRRQGRMFMNNILLSSGLEIIVMGNGQARWSGRTVGGTTAVPTEELASAKTASGIFKVWMRQMPPGRFPRNLPLTESAAAVRADWNREEDDFMMKCIAPGMPFAMLGVGPHPIEISEKEGVVIIRAEYFDIERSIYMNSSKTPESLPDSLFGLSIGHWENEVLIVRTSNIDWPWFDRTGVPLSQSAVVEERFTPGADEAELNYDIKVTDPETFTEPVEAHWRWRWHPELEIQPYECTLGAV